MFHNRLCCRTVGLRARPRWSSRRLSTRGVAGRPGEGAGAGGPGGRGWWRAEDGCRAARGRARNEAAQSAQAGGAIRGLARSAVVLRTGLDLLFVAGKAGGQLAVAAVHPIFRRRTASAVAVTGVQKRPLRAPVAVAMAAHRRAASRRRCSGCRRGRANDGRGAALLFVGWWAPHGADALKIASADRPARALAGLLALTSALATLSFNHHRERRRQRTPPLHPPAARRRPRRLRQTGLHARSSKSVALPSRPQLRRWSLALSPPPSPHHLPGSLPRLPLHPHRARAHRQAPLHSRARRCFLCAALPAPAHRQPSRSLGASRGSGILVSSPQRRSALLLDIGASPPRSPRPNSYPPLNFCTRPRRSSSAFSSCRPPSRPAAAAAPSPPSAPAHPVHRRSSHHHTPRSAAGCPLPVPFCPVTALPSTPAAAFRAWRRRPLSTKLILPR